MYSKKSIVVELNLPSSYLNENIEEEIENKTRMKLYRKEIEGVGLIIDIYKIKNIESGEITINGLAKFFVEIEVETYLPYVGEKINSTIKEISFHGYRLNEPIEIFIAIQTDKKKNSLKIDDKKEVSITKVSFNKDKFIVLAKEVK